MNSGAHLANDTVTTCSVVELSLPAAGWSWGWSDAFSGRDLSGGIRDP